MTEKNNSEVEQLGKRIAYARVFFTALAVLWLTVQPAVAVHDGVSCPTPETFQPLMMLLHDLATIAQLGGYVLAFIGLSIGGLVIAGPFGPEWNQRGRTIIKAALLGVAILLSAKMILAFLVGHLPICPSSGTGGVNATAMLLL